MKHQVTLVGMLQTGFVKKSNAGKNHAHVEPARAHGTYKFAASSPLCWSPFNRAACSFPYGFPISQCSRQVRNRERMFTLQHAILMMCSHTATLARDFQNCCCITTNWRVRANLSGQKANGWRQNIVSGRCVERVIGRLGVQLEVGTQSLLQLLKSSQVCKDPRE